MCGGGFWELGEVIRGREEGGFTANPQGGAFLYIPVGRFSHTSPSDDYEFTTLQHSIRSSLTNNTSMASS